CALPVLEESEMDMKKRSSYRRHASGNIRKKGDKDRLAAELAPLEEQDKSAAEQQIGSHQDSIKGQADPDYGAIVVDNENLKVPIGIGEARDETRFFGIEPVVLVVLIIMLSFIAFIAWQISLMPR
ncbi:MAG TPA: hypothetical protein VFU83_05500, partial [Pyrinomonadaceae bacterium]|nr:hypothetical protein [Pyrinomonadaceae bacterium]